MYNEMHIPGREKRAGYQSEEGQLHEDDEA